MTTPTKTVTAFTISRTEWLRGEGGNDSCLLRDDDQKRCCVGIYAKALGVHDDDVREGDWPESPDCSWQVSHTEAEWLLDLTDTLMQANDDETADESGREQRVAAIFAAQGITVTFID